MKKEGIKSQLKLFIPLVFMTITSSLYLFVEKLFLVRLSPQSMEAAVNSAYICQIFQLSSIALAMMAQVFVAKWTGAQERKMIGPGIWQYIWFSCFSCFVTIPLSYFVGSYYFQGTVIGESVQSYFNLQMGMNFLYPFGAALSCYFSGQGKTRLILFGTVGTQLAKIGLSYLLIFGGLGLAQFGMIGGALSTVIAHAGFCSVLFLVFLSAKHREQFATGQWRFQWNLFKECIYPGFLRALNRILTFSCWASIAHMMTVRGGDYALILSMGGTLFFFLSSLGDALCQTQTTILAQLMGAGKYDDLSQAKRCGYLLALTICLALAVPFLLFPIQTAHSLFPTVQFDVPTIRYIFFGVFCSFVWFVISYIPISFVLACKDMRFSLFMGAFNWVNGYLVMVLFFEVFHIAAATFWLALSVMHASIALFYSIRARYLFRQFSEKPQLAF